MEICFHAGLHKSGTTTVQKAFARAYGHKGRVWYPVLQPYDINHHFLVWPLIFRYRGDMHYAATVTDRPGGEVSLRSVVDNAAKSGVERLVIASEALDALTDDDVAGLREACAGHGVRAVFTVTPPHHRWASHWQEFVKFGLGAAPTPASLYIAIAASQNPSRLSGLITRFPAERKFVRLVPRTSIDEGLVPWIAEVFELDPINHIEAEPANVSMGSAIALLAFLNSRGITNGIFTERDKRIFEAKRDELGGRRIDDFSRGDFEVPASVVDVGRAEREFLTGATASGEIVLSDPEGQLPDWDTIGLPRWYEEIRDGSNGPGGLLQDPVAVDAEWNRAYRLFSAEANLGNAKFDEGVARLELEHVHDVLRQVRAELRAIKTSRTWRWTSAARRPLAPVVRLLRRSTSTPARTPER